MKIQINSHHTVETSERFADFVRKTIEQSLYNCKTQITRVEVYFSDENGKKSGVNEKRCVMEARLAGRKPIAVTNHANTLDEVIRGTAEKLKHALESILDKEHDHHPGISEQKEVLIDEFLERQNRLIHQSIQSQNSK